VGAFAHQALVHHDVVEFPKAGLHALEPLSPPRHPLARKERCEELAGVAQDFLRSFRPRRSNSPAANARFPPARGTALEPLLTRKLRRQLKPLFETNASLEISYSHSSPARNCASALALLNGLHPAPAGSARPQHDAVAAKLLLVGIEIDRGFCLGVRMIRQRAKEWNLPKTYHACWRNLEASIRFTSGSS
jgi:hypothetical protein